MKFTLLALAMLAMSSASGNKDHPIKKIIGMLEELKVESQKTQEEEAVLHQKFEYWCKTTTKDLTKQITKEKEEIAVLEDTIEAKTKEIAKLDADLEILAKQIEENGAASAKADKIREEEEETYKSAVEDFDLTIEGINQCIDALEGTKGDVASLLAQKSVMKVINFASMMVSDQENEVLSSFLQEMKQPKKPKAKVYSFKSQGVIELLKKLLEKFEADKLETVKAETNALNAYNLAKQAREEAMEAFEKSKKEKEDIKGEAEKALTAAQDDLASTKEDMAANEKSLEDVTSDCQSKLDEFKARSEAREGEILAIGMAIKVLAKVGGVRAPEAELQSGATPSATIDRFLATSFIQIDDPKAQAVKVLIAEATKLHSKSLRRLAQQINAHLSGPFDSINQMIQKMIFRLMAEQKDEDDHKNWCDLESEKSLESRDDKQAKKEELEDKIAEAKATVQKLSEDIVALTDEVSNIVSAIETATEERKAEKAENEATIKDAQDAQKAVTAAIAVLEDFYKSQGSFVQTGDREPVEVEASPETWENDSSGLQNPDGVLDIMKTCGADFAKMEADTVADEQINQNDYDKMVTDESINKAGKEQEIDDKTRNKAKLNDKISTWEGKHKHVASELEAVVQYLKDLIPACGDAEEADQNKEDYEARKQARTDEIEALRKAQTILEDAFKEKLFLQRTASIRQH